jgi:hypothetical protein
LNGTGPRLDSTNGVAVAGPVAVRLVHQQYQVRQTSQVIEVAVAQHFLHPLDARLLAAAYLGVDLRDVEDVDTYVVGEAYRLIVYCCTGLVVVVAGDDQRRLLRELGNPFEHVLRRVAREVCDELVVDRQVGRKHEEVVDAVRQMQVGDEGPHQARLAHARGQRETQRWKFALEVLQRTELGLQRGENGRDITLVS